MLSYHPLVLFQNPLKEQMGSKEFDQIKVLSPVELFQNSLKELAGNLEDDQIRSSHPFVLFQNALKELINKHDDDQIKVSSLEEMRSTFSDLLADFQCMGKDIYAIVPTQGTVFK